MGFGAHRIEGIGDKHVTWIHNVWATDLLVCVDDLECLEGLQLLQEGTEALVAEGVPDASCLVDLFGISGVCNVLGAIRAAAHYRLGPRQAVVTVATDGFDRYPSVLRRLDAEEGPMDAERAKSRVAIFRSRRTGWLLEGTTETRRRWHNQKYFTWVEQQGRSAAELRTPEDPAFWAAEQEKAHEIDQPDPGAPRVSLPGCVSGLACVRCGRRYARVLDAHIGMRVLVPFGRQKLIGIIVGKPDASEVPENKLKRAIAVLDDAPLLSRADLRLLEFAVEYYVHPLGAVVMATLPVALRRVRTREPAPGAYALTAAGAAVDVDTLPLRAKAQRGLLVMLQSQAVVDHTAVSAAGDATRKALKVFVAQGWVQPAARSEPAAVATVPKPAAGPQLTAEQAAATEAIIAALGSYQALLLWGITGSGKTEVYLHAIAAAWLVVAKCWCWCPRSR